MREPNYKTRPLVDETLWISNKKYKPDCDDLCLVEDIDSDYTIAKYDPDDRLWFDRDMAVIDVRRWMYIPE